jgi:hypothetical protein
MSSGPQPDSASPPAAGSPPTVTRRIGLSLGADICWPLCFEHMVRRLDVAIPWQGTTVKVEVDRVPIEPFSLQQPCGYDVVLDRLTHWYPLRREWIKRAILMDGLYVFNNPWSIQSMEKHTTYAAMMHLGMPIPDTWMIPPKTYEDVPDLRYTLRSYARLFDLRKVGDAVGYPSFIKPYDGGGWKGVSHVAGPTDLLRRYEESGTALMHLQKAVDPHDLFVRCIGIGPQTRLVRYDATAPLHDRYTMDEDFLDPDQASVLADITLTINAFFGWDFNSCEALRQGDTWHPIDFANACPDSQVTSLHYHFPWLVRAKLRWALFCAVTRRPMRRTLDWDPFYAVAAEPDLPWRERLRRYAAIARARFDHEAFEAFCTQHLGHLDAELDSFLTSPEARDAVHRKVANLYPAHEVEAFTTLFWNRMQAWRTDHPPVSGGGNA